MSRGQTGIGIQELFFQALVANSNPRQQCDTGPMYHPTCPVCRESQVRRRRGNSCSQQRLAREHRILLPSAPTRRLLSRSGMRKRVTSRSELDPACTWLSLAGGRPGKIGTGLDFKCLEIQSTRDVNFSLGRKNSKKPVPECSRAGVSRLQPRTRPNLVFCLFM